MTESKKTSSSEISTKAGKILSDPNASEIQKKLAGSALSQTDPEKHTSAEMEEIAGKALQSEKYNKTTKSLAGSVLSQANHDDDDES
ncbi:MAG: hypothetical protein F6K24_56485 [Okeania sp. SIO2D1]|nr:hypothetical protein [Okeania sp. SIO2D1]